MEGKSIVASGSSEDESGLEPELRIENRRGTSSDLVFEDRLKAELGQYRDNSWCVGFDLSRQECILHLGLC